MPEQSPSPPSVDMGKLALESVLMWPLAYGCCIVGGLLVSAGDVAFGGVSSSLADIAGLSVIFSIPAAFVLAAWAGPLREPVRSAPDLLRAVGRAYLSPLLLVTHGLRSLWMLTLGLGALGLGCAGILLAIALIVLVVGGILGLLLFGFRQLFG